jgi:Arc/MetJ-type ribon-helix-helix transcriptional regulator
VDVLECEAQNWCLTNLQHWYSINTALLQHSYSMNPEQRITVSLPDILRAKMDKYIETRRVEYKRYSMNDCVVEAIRAFLDAPVPRATQTDVKRVAAASAPILGSDPGFGKNPLEFLAARAGNAPAPVAQATRERWASRLNQLAQEYQIDPGSAQEDLAYLINGRVTLGANYANWHSMPKTRAALAEYLDKNAPLEAE